MEDVLRETNEKKTDATLSTVAYGMGQSFRYKGLKWETIIYNVNKYGYVTQKKNTQSFT